MEDGFLYKKILDSMSIHVALLAGDGTIVDTNRAWRSFGETNGLRVAEESAPYNYLTVCDQSSLAPDDDSAMVAQGIRQVLHGYRDEFLMQYPCHSPEEKRWYVIRVVPHQVDGERRAIVSHENITPIIEVQKELERKEEELRNQTVKLEETNIALRVLLEKRDEDRENMEATVFTNVDRLAIPYLEKLASMKLADHQKTLVEIVRDNLKEIVSPFLRHLSSLEARLTPHEIEVAHLVRNGRSSKEIADILFLSVAGVDFHRKNLRKKFGLTHSRQNLRTFLMSLR